MEMKLELEHCPLCILIYGAKLVINFKPLMQIFLFIL